MTTPPAWSSTPTVVVAAIGARRDVVLVAQSMGGFTAPLVAERVPTRLIILLNAMVPLPGEPPGEWWERSGWNAEHGPMGPDFDPVHEFLHDLPADLRDRMTASPPRQQSGTPFEKPWPLTAWPDVPTRFLQATDDRFLPIAFQRRVVRERLGFDPDEMPGGHLVALSRPTELAARLDAYVR